MKREQTLQLRKILKDVLDQRGVTAAQISRKTGVAKQVLSDWLAGVTPRRIDQLKKVADELGVTIDYLCFGSDRVPPRPVGDIIEGVFEIRMRRIGAVLDASQPADSQRTGDDLCE